MQIKSIVAGAAIALAVGFGTAAAGEVRFSVLGGIPATPMTQAEMAAVVGEGSLVLTTGLLSPQGIGINTVAGPAPEKILASAIGGGVGLFPLPANLSLDEN